MTRIAIAEDNTLMREGLALICNACDFMVQIKAANGLELIKKLNECESLPDIILMDINMPALGGLETTVLIREKFAQIKIIALSFHANDKLIISMLKSGAVGYISKAIEISEFKNVVNTVLDNNIYVDKTLLQKWNIPTDFLKDDKKIINLRPSLSKKEFQFLTYCVSDYSYKEIADKMKISPRTADTYRAILFDKLNVKSRQGIAIYAIINSLIL